MTVEQKHPDLLRLQEILGRIPHEEISAFAKEMHKSREKENLKSEISYLQMYFAAHAPEVPKLFRKNWEKESHGKNDETGLIVEWRYQYAKRLASKFSENFPT